MSDIFTYTPGHLPLLVTIPHSGTLLPHGMEARLTPYARTLPDTDWYVDHLYACAHALGASTLRARYSRYVTDLNRGADNAELYPGRPSTGVVPTHAFNGSPLYLPEQEPTEAEIQERIGTYWHPYHNAIIAELERLRAQWGWAILWDAHSIRSHIPHLFEGTLPALNFGTNGGASCAADLTEQLVRHTEQNGGYTHVLNGRFKGGYTTRHYGQPQNGIHAVQLELAQSSYLASEDSPWPMNLHTAAKLGQLIENLLRLAIDYRPDR
ncbi:N-formylglutamate deformylase [Acetobacter sp.]|jgi:N-formylglutamate amidohydrolase|uniref:N-formylglutamate deformylase n=1 Tax=Acetobacter sp. TaxID=440 RepID=UPI0025C25B49|nr:N-formylglutamate deformylase [Acetobacter sp.]MCH4089785.1 N-formylglutamate deformylase [Acetobacter sp.]MCI1298481.1 N-formylglutamate deformylase [Acetobacter sp.]